MAKRRQRVQERKVNKSVRRDTKKQQTFGRKQGKKQGRADRKTGRVQDRSDLITDVIEAREDIVMERIGSRTDRGLARTDALKAVGTGEGVQAGFAMLGEGVGRSLSPAGNFGMSEYQSESDGIMKDPINTKGEKKSPIMIIAVIAVVLIFVMKGKKNV